ncbi:MAG: DUF2520 domain-containing protein [Desulfobacteraceae bacterium]|nr:DUF2520 domain-containing protein [Desulfobacteraceae bacterium]
MNTNNKNLEFCIIGCGRLGISLAVFLSKQGYIPKAFSSQRIESAQKAVEFTGAGTVVENPVEAVGTCNLTFITTPDTIIEPVCEAISKENGFDNDSVVYHLSGALSSSILTSAKKNGASTGSIHPLQAFAPYEKGQDSPFKGINMSIEGDPKAVELGKEIVNALKANSFTIPTDAKTVYHASAVVASNYLVTLEHFALELLKEANLSEQSAYEILEPLIMGTLNNIKARGSIDALTGPVARGDDEIVSKHLNDIDKKMPQFSDLYRLLGKYTLDIASKRGEIDDTARQRLAKLFKL